MSREQYLEMRRTGQYDLGLFYNYYVENKDKKVPTLPLEIFIHLSRIYLQDLIVCLDVKFNTTKLEDNQGNLINIS